MADGKNFCSKCGTTVVKAKCGKCQAELESDAKFCGGCGAKVDPK
jgi:predicted amidophosphoribosyltransferase